MKRFQIRDEKGTVHKVIESKRPPIWCLLSYYDYELWPKPGFRPSYIAFHNTFPHLIWIREGLEPEKRLATLKHEAAHHYDSKLSSLKMVVSNLLPIQSTKLTEWNHAETTAKAQTIVIKEEEDDR